MGKLTNGTGGKPIFFDLTKDKNSFKSKLSHDLDVCDELTQLIHQDRMIETHTGEYTDVTIGNVVFELPVL